VTPQPAGLPTVRRLPEKQVRDVAWLYALLDAGLVAHVAVPAATGGESGTDGELVVVPLAYARDDDQLLVHGSTASRAFRTLATGVPTCATVTVVDGMVVARSQFESSMQYRSAMMFGSFRAVHGTAKERALAKLAARLLPGLDGARPPAPQELRATAVLELPLETWSLKVSGGPPEDNRDDLDRPVWAGVVPLERRWGEPVTAPDLTVDCKPPAALATWPVRG
jgi:nitroimidazol reductase NimA-like FMN-containing flavoprotein (pyridoxamine 5'-phosphate oxidase superfamily)